ncbi:MAG: hypothetical protein Q8M66_03350, partial [Actinomycetota bacterium]|nr:hypothetical protein [Actinomycetota bacterium]
DLYSPSYQQQQVVWDASDLEPGTHTLRIEWTGRKNPTSTHNYVTIDALDVDGSLVVVDLTPPVTTLSAPKDWSRGPADITLMATDTVTAVHRTYYKIGEGEVQTYNGPFSISEEGITSIRYWSVDVRGNVEDPTTETVRIDDTVPVTTSDIDEAWQNGPVSVVLSEQGDGLSPASTLYRLDGGEVETYTAPLQISTEGVTSVEYWSVDEAGNVEDPTTETVRIDDTVPVTTSGATETYHISAVISLHASDASSGVQHTKWRLNDGSWTTGTTVTTNQGGVHTLEFYSVDNAGNVEQVKTVSFTVVARYDQEDPNLVYTKTWNLQNRTTYWNGSHRIVSATGASVNAAFTGTKVAWIARTGPDYGIARVTLDGGTPVDVDLYSPSYQQQQVVWDASDLEPGTHTLRIEWTGRKNPTSTHNYVTIDA